MTYNTQIIKDCLELFKTKGSDFAETFYKNFWTDYPECKELFINTEMSAQKKALTNGLITIIENLDNLEQLRHYLVDSGIRHVTYGILPPHYPMIKSNLQKTLKEVFSENWISEVEDNWNLLIEFIIINMKIGALEVRPDLSEGFHKAEVP